jgi:hypothetical protein
MFCIIDRCQFTDHLDRKLLLPVVEGEFAHEQTQEHLSCHREGGNRDIIVTSPTRTVLTSATAPKRSS